MNNQKSKGAVAFVEPLTWGLTADYLGSNAFEPLIEEFAKSFKHAVRSLAQPGQPFSGWSRIGLKVIVESKLYAEPKAKSGVTRVRKKDDVLTIYVRIANADWFRKAVEKQRALFETLIMACFAAASAWAKRQGFTRDLHLFASASDMALKGFRTKKFQLKGYKKLRARDF